MTWQTMNLEQRIFLIKAVYRHGMSARDIAAAIGASKGSVVGIYSRHKDALADFPLGTAQYVREAAKAELIIALAFMYAAAYGLYSMVVFVI